MNDTTRTAELVRHFMERWDLDKYDVPPEALAALLTERENAARMEGRLEERRLRRAKSQRTKVILSLIEDRRKITKQDLIDSTSDVMTEKQLSNALASLTRRNVINRTAYGCYESLRGRSDTDEAIRSRNDGR